MDIVLGRDADVTAKGFRRVRQAGIRNVSGVLQSLVGGVKKNALLRINATRFTGRDVEEPVVKGVGFVDEVAGVGSHRAFGVLGRVRSVVGNLEAVLRNLKEENISNHSPHR